MKFKAFSLRTAKEILRDPLNIFFGVGFPVILMIILTAIDKGISANVPGGVTQFGIDSLAPSMTVFGLSFMALFSAMLVAKDRETALLQRLFSTPLTVTDFIFGYTLPIIPLIFLQSIVCYIVALILGLEFSLNILLSLITIIPIGLFFIGIGLFFGSLLQTKQVGGICGALLTNVTVFLSGMMFDLALIGGAFEKVAKALPFYHAIEVQKAVLAGNFSDITPHIYIVVAYAVGSMVISIAVFLRQMKRQ